MFVRNKIVVCNGEGSGKYDPGKIDSLGDRHWTRWYGVTNVRVEDEKGNVVSCIFNEFMHKVRAYRFTFSSTLAHARIAIGGDFLFVISEDANAGYGFADEDERYTYLLSDQKIGEHVEQSDLFKSATGIAIPVETSLFFSFDQPGKIPVTSEELSTNKDQWLTESKQHFEDQLVLYPNVYVCGPAVRIKLKEKDAEWRWLFPHSNGVVAAVEHLKKTTHEDDWMAIQEYFDECTDIERERVINHFESINAI